MAKKKSIERSYRSHGDFFKSSMFCVSYLLSENNISNNNSHNIRMLYAAVPFRSSVTFSNYVTYLCETSSILQDWFLGKKLRSV